jgi:hypothetical protein
MGLLVVCFVLAVLVTIGAGILAHRYSANVFGGPTAWGAAAARRLGAIPGAIVVALIGWAVVAGTGLAMGLAARHLEHSVDRPVYKWITPRVSDNKFTRANEKLTLIGNNPIIEIVCLIAFVILAFAYKRRWWIPAFAIAGAFLGEKYLQKFLAKEIHRGHPPTTLGTYPSGGVGRILAVYGAIMILVILLLPLLSRAWRAGLWTGVVTAAVVEAFTRIYLSKHWLTDAVFGLPFGALLLLTNVAAISALAYTRAPARHPAPSQPAPAPSRLAP